MGRQLSSNEIASILSNSKSRGPKKDPTEPRVLDTWFNLKNHRIREEGCDNPNCLDPREEGTRGVNVVTEVKGKFMCRYCFVGGWLSNLPTTAI